MVCAVGRHTETAIEFEVGQPARLSLQSSLTPCRPPCERALTSSCAWTREGNTFHLRAQVVVRNECDGSPIPGSCNVYAPECVTEPLAAGEYTVTDGTRTHTFRVPSTVASDTTCATSTR